LLCRIDHHFVQLHGNRRAAGDALRQSGGGVAFFAGRYDAVDQPDTVGFDGVDELTGIGELARFRQSHDAGHEISAAVSDSDAKIHFGKPELCVFGRYDQIAGEQ
jgi:hypothetical protein